MVIMIPCPGIHGVSITPGVAKLSKAVNVELQKIIVADRIYAGVLTAMVQVKLLKIRA